MRSRHDISSIAGLDLDKLLQPLEVLHECRICPHNCGADRFSNKLGYCRSDASFYISSICAHRGEEPPISGANGICNIFFGHCNLQCVYCQNHQISQNNRPAAATQKTLPEVLKEIINLLNNGCQSVGFVSPSHFAPQMQVIINALHALDIHPVTVYNTNGYDKVETLREIGPLIDVYLPDFKYMDNKLSGRFSDAPDYPEVAKAALAEIYNQKGAALLLNDDGIAMRGIIIRHLVLPGFVENSISVLKHIADELSTSMHISLMSQYHPTPMTAGLKPIDRTLTENEYQQVVDTFYALGFYRGFIQDLESYNSYRPDFRKTHPFEGEVD